MAVTQEPPIPSQIVERRIHLPFIDTDPLIDIALVVILLPLWWALGIEQFIWPIILGIAAAKVLYLQRWRVRISAPLKWFGLFIVAVLLSSFFIVEPIRWMTYARNFGAIIAGFLTLFVITNRAHSWRSIEILLNAALLAIIIAGVMGLLAVVGIWRPSFQSIAGNLLPASAAATGYGQMIVFRALGDQSWFLGLGDYYRVHSLFLFSNSYSSVLVYAIPLLFFKLEQYRGLKKALIILAIVLLLINLIYTTGRVATLALLGGAFFFALFYSLRRRAIRAIVGLGLALLILSMLFSTVVELSSTSQDEGVISQFVSAVNSFVFARGPGSFVSRTSVYQATLVSFAERPLFGWGTERDVEGLDLPLGSHSEYFAVLYRQGLFGIIAFAGLLWAVWRAAKPPPGAAALSPAGTFLRYGRWFFITSLINSIMTDPTIDSSEYVLLWLLIALLIASAQLLYRQGAYDLRTN